MPYYQKNIRREFISSVFVVILILLLGKRTVFAETSGSYGDNLTWSLNSAGTLTISGYGAMKDYNIPQNDPMWDRHIDIPWLKNGNDGIIKKVIIGNNITSIGSCAFYWCPNLEEIVLPDTLESIGHNAFYSCTSLLSVDIPSSVTSIGNVAFCGCSNLKSIIIVRAG